MYRRIIILLCFLSLISGCGTSVGIRPNAADSPEAGVYYQTKVDGEVCFFCIDNISGGDNFRGHYYLSDGDGYASRRSFSASSSRRRVVVKTDSGRRKFSPRALKYVRYEEPEFVEVATGQYRKPSYEVDIISEVPFGRARGYWESLQGVEAEVYKVFTAGYVKSFRKRDLNLKMDIYLPHGAQGPRPLILFIHGGAFYVGNKEEPAYVDFCRTFASLGYVTASMNYRLGFHVGKGEIERAGYVALQDAHAAMRYLVSHAGEYGIDTSELYVAGSSAGSITALNLAFMTEEDRPKSSHGGKGLFNGDDLGTIDSSGNDIKADFHIRAVANMWGAVNSLDILKNSSTSIVSFHGDADNVVPYAHDYPFSSAGEIIARGLSDKMFGSECIDSAATALGLRSKFYSFAGEGHALNTTGKEKTPNANHQFIKEKITDFFFREMVPQDASIRDDGRGRFSISGSYVTSVQWCADGGFILSSSGNEAKVLWREDETGHRIQATGTQHGDVGFVTVLDL